MKKKRFLMPVIGLVAIAIFSAAVMLLWNCLIPAIFGLTTISFWQALGLLALTRILFGGISGGMRGRFGGHGMRGFGRMNDKNNLIRERWMQMSDEERKEFMKKRKMMRDFGAMGGFRDHCQHPFEKNENNDNEK